MHRIDKTWVERVSKEDVLDQNIFFNLSLVLLSKKLDYF